MATHTIADETTLNNSTLNFTTIEQDFYSGIRITVADAFKTESRFRSFWKSHKSNDSPPPSLPNIDFDTNMIIAVFRGEKNTGGYNINITSIEENDSEIIVRGEMTNPPTGGVTTQVLTQPYHIVSVKTSNKSIRYIIKEVDGSRPFPTFILGVEDDVDVDAQVEQIENIEAVQSVNYLQGVQMIFVYFDSEQITAEEAYDLMLGINGTTFVEADPPIGPEVNNDEGDDDEGNIFDNDNKWSPSIACRCFSIFCRFRHGRNLRYTKYENH